jgi:hypothetical protein
VLGTVSSLVTIDQIFTRALQPEPYGETNRWLVRDLVTRDDAH